MQAVTQGPGQRLCWQVSGRADTDALNAMGAPEKPFPLLGMAVTETKPLLPLCPATVSQQAVPGAKGSSCLLIAEWLLQLEFLQD